MDRARARPLILIGSGLVGAATYVILVTTLYNSIEKGEPVPNASLIYWTAGLAYLAASYAFAWAWLEFRWLRALPLAIGLAIFGPPAFMVVGLVAGFAVGFLGGERPARLAMWIAGSSPPEETLPASGTRSGESSEPSQAPALAATPAEPIGEAGPAVRLAAATLPAGSHTLLRARRNRAVAALTGGLTAFAFSAAGSVLEVLGWLPADQYGEREIVRGFIFGLATVTLPLLVLYRLALAGRAEGLEPRRARLDLIIVFLLGALGGNWVHALIFG